MMTTSRNTRALLRNPAVLLTLTLAVGGLLLAAGSTGARADDLPGDSRGGAYDLSVTVVTPTPTPGASVPPTPPASGGSNGGGASPASSQRTTTTVDAATTVTPVSAPLASGQTSLGGKLFLDGVRSVYRPSVNPFDGTVFLEFTVKNVSNETVDASAQFWANSPFGSELGVVEDVAVAQLAPGESRIVSAEISGIAQWIVLDAGYTFTPPASIEGIAMDAVSRSALLFVFPWALSVVGFIAVAGVFAVRLVLTRERTSLATLNA